MVDLELDDDVATITIDRPHACNAIALDTMEQLEKALDGAEGARVLVITGAGERAFVAGGDLRSLASVRTEVEASAMTWRMRSIYDRIAGLPCPTIAALNGHSLGGGSELAVSTDIRIAADDIKISFNQVKLEIMPGWGGAERLAALIGPSRALLLAGTGRMVDAVEAERIGLIDQIVPRESFHEAWRSLARSLAARPVADIKRVIAGVPATQAVAAFARLWATDEHWQAADKVLKRRN